MKNKIVIDTVQVALFPIYFRVGNVYALADRLVKEGLLEGGSNTTTINSFLNADAPGDITRIKGPIPKGNGMEIDFSQTKINLFWRNFNGADGNFDFAALENYLEKYIKCLDQNLNFWRVGYITSIYKEEDRALEVAKTLWSSKKGVVTAISYEVTYDDTKSYKVEEWKGVKFNKYVKISHGNKISNPKIKVVLIQHDLNTREDPKVNWKLETVQKFLKVAHGNSESDKIYNEFFKE